MVEEGNKIASVAVALPQLSSLEKYFAAQIDKRHFSPQKLTAKHRPAGHIQTLDKPIILKTSLCFSDNFSIQH